MKQKLGRSVQELKFPAKSLLLSNNANFVQNRHIELAAFLSEFINHPFFGLGNFRIGFWTYFERHLHRESDFLAFDDMFKCLENKGTSFLEDEVR